MSKVSFWICQCLSTDLMDFYLLNTEFGSLLNTEFGFLG